MTISLVSLQQGYLKKIWLIILIICILYIISPVSAIGSVTTAGDEILKTDQLRNLTGGDGQGIRVGVISNGVKHLADAQKTGDLSADVHVLKTGKMDEGTAMLEIIHDLAPNASLYYADSGDNDLSFSEAIDSLVAAGCNIIVDDVGLLEIPYFEDGRSAVHLKEILLQHPDLLFVSAAGNNGQLHYQGMFTDAGGGFNSFNGSPGIPVDMNSGGFMGTILEWDDSYEQRQNPYSLYLYDRQTGAEIAVSERTESGEKRSLEKLYYQYIGDKPLKAEIRVKKTEEAEPKLLELILKIDKNLVSIPEGYMISSDSIIGQAAVDEVISVAAVPAVQSPTIEKFSSQGEVTIAYPTQIERKKPDISGLNSIEVSGAGKFPSPFTGTSAAAPHIAGLLALVWSLFPQTPGERMKEAMFQTATPFDQQGWSPVYGYGLPNAVKMYEYLHNTSANQTQQQTITPTPTRTTVPTPTQPPVEETGTSSVITGSVEITEPGEYTLGSDILDSSETIIRISSSDVTLDGTDHQIEGFAVQFGLESPPLQRGIVIESPDQSRLKNITIKNLAVMGTYVGISARNTDGLVIDSCRLPYNTIGMILSGVSHADVKKNTINGNAQYGLVMDQGTSDSVISTNDLKKNLIGMVLDKVSNNRISGNSVILSHQEGILLKGGSTSNIIEKNGCSGNGNGGIVLKSSLKNSINNNICEQNSPPGIYLEESSENLISDNTLTGNLRGLNLYYSDTNTITNNSVLSNKISGIMFQPSGRNIVSQNRIAGNTGEGILISGSVTPEKVNLISDNYLENENNVNIQEGANPNYAWNGEKSQGTNIVGGPYTGGNVWALADGKGFSQTCPDIDGDGLCDAAYSVLPGVTDELPLKYSGSSIIPDSPVSSGSTIRPPDPEDLLTEGLSLFGKGKYEEAVALMDKAIDTSPTNFQAWRLKVLSLSKMKKSDESIATANEALSLYPESIILWYTLGDIYLLDLAEYQKAISAYQKALAIDKDDTHSLTNLAFAMDKSGRSDEALKLYLQAITINPSLTDAWVKAANIETRANNFNQAIQHYDKALSLDPGNAFTWNNKGYALSLAGDYEGAIQAYQNAIQIDNSYDVAWTNLGNAYTALGKKQEADKAYSHSHI
nr:NosD domain-containing protein [uncultured Methanospirillum sp.]